MEDQRLQKVKKAAAVAAVVLSLGYLYWKLSKKSIETPISKLQKEYDYIVVGSGSSGAVVASRLSEDPNVRVLVLEAGGADDLSFICTTPIASFLVQGTQSDWKFKSEPQEHSQKMFVGDQSKWPRGKIIGGSSNLNYMAYVRGNSADYDKWEEMGCEGWSYEKVLPYFKKSEDIRVSQLKDSKYHQTGGPLAVSPTSYPLSITKTFLQACTELGIRENPDYNGENQFGASEMQHTTKNGQRWSTSRAFLRPALQKRSNIHLITHAHVARVLINDKKEAIGVVYQSTRDGKIGPEVTIKAKREVIISAGAVQSPQVLLLSGIGPRDQLEKLGIPVVVDNPNVGENLRDHLMVPVFMTTKVRTVTAADASSLISLLRYILFKNGPLASTLLEATVFLKTGARPDLKQQPDLQIHFSPYCGSSKDMKNVGVKPELIKETDSDFGKNGGVGIIPILLHPKSIGHIRLKSKNPFESPIIQPNYLSHEDDVKTLVAGMQLTQKIMGTKTVQAVFESEIHGGTWDRITEKNSPYSAKWCEDYIRHGASTVYHPIGTCAMGPRGSTTAVVDPELRVIGVKNLRVIDCSIMPLHVSGNTNAPAIMVGEKGADLIKASWKK